MLRLFAGSLFFVGSLKFENLEFNAALRENLVKSAADMDCRLIFVCLFDWRVCEQDAMNERIDVGVFVCSSG